MSVESQKINLTDEAAKAIILKAIHEIKYITEYKKYVDNSNEKMEQLSAKLESMLLQVEAAQRSVETILPDVELWIKRVEKIIEEEMKEVKALQDKANSNFQGLQSVEHQVPA